MHGSPELLEFYLVEATEYLDALDQLVGVVGDGGAPDENALIATARALRGSSTMAKADVIADIAALLERLAVAARDGGLRWTMDLHHSLRATVDDLRFLVRGVRTWGEREDARAQARLADLRRFAPDESPRTPPPPAESTAPVFVALQASAIAAELDAFVVNPAHRRALDDALTRARTLRGFAGIADLPPLAEVADAVDRAGRALMPDAPLADADAELFRAAAAVLRRASEELRNGIVPSTEVDEVVRFARAAAALDRPAPQPEQVVPIAELFYSDAGPHILQRSAAPPMTPERRFRDDMAARAEHLRRLVGDARQAYDLASRDRLQRALTSALRELSEAATSFGGHQVASFFGQMALEHPLLDSTVLDAVEGGALLLGSPSDSLDEVERRLAVMERARRVTPAIGVRETPEGAEMGRPTGAGGVAEPGGSVGVAGAGGAAGTAGTAEDAEDAEERGDVGGGGGQVAPDVGGGGAVAAVPAPPAAAPPAAGPPPRPPRRPPATPTGRELQELLQVGIAGFQQLDDSPLNEPVALEGDDIVPIETLLFRGRAALQRAIDVRDDLQERGTTDPDSLQEIFDLLDLAQTE